jgi:hypothetical protein
MLIVSATLTIMATKVISHVVKPSSRRNAELFTISRLRVTETINPTEAAFQSACFHLPSLYA